jgi:hypothetical protein
VLFQDKTFSGFTVAISIYDSAGLSHGAVTAPIELDDLANERINYCSSKLSRIVASKLANPNKLSAIQLRFHASVVSDLFGFIVAALHMGLQCDNFIAHLRAISILADLHSSCTNFNSLFKHGLRHHTS